MATCADTMVLPGNTPLRCALNGAHELHWATDTSGVDRRWPSTDQRISAETVTALQNRDAVAAARGELR